MVDHHLSYRLQFVRVQAQEHQERTRAAMTKRRVRFDFKLSDRDGQVLPTTMT
jgi:hypothetical protein